MLEVVEDEDHGRVGEGGLQEPEPPRVIQPRIGELLATELQRGTRRLEQGVSHDHRDRAELPGPDVRRDQQAVLGQAAHRATGDGDLADSADADQRERATLAQPVDRAGGVLRVARRAQHPE